MADFIQARESYTAARKLFLDLRHQKYLIRQQELRIRQEIGQLLEKQRLAQLPEGHPNAIELDQISGQLAEAGLRLAKAEEELTQARQIFFEAGEVHKTLTNLNDSTPILLLPLRLQTRFLTIKHIARDCPDELLVDMGKITNRSIHSRMRVVLPKQQPAPETLRGISAQQALLSNIDSPAARQLINELNGSSAFSQVKSRWVKVEDKYELLVRIFPDDIFMQTHESALTKQEMVSARNFWQDLWNIEVEFSASAKDEIAKEAHARSRLAAWRTLNLAHTPHRAAWLARVMRPKNFSEGDIPAGRQPEFPDPDAKTDAWTLAPRAELLPEQFVIRLVFNDASLAAKEIAGSPVPDSLQLGLDPDETDDDAFAEEADTLRLPAAIRWLTDFEEAEKIGMAVRIPLSRLEVNAGIARMTALGVKTGADASEGARLLGSLFENHRFRADSMAFLPQGTPTNNLPGMPSGFTRAGLSPDETFSNEFPELPFSPDPESDGGRFVRALGLDANAVGPIFNHHLQECSQALTINRALWPGTLGYFLDQMMRPAIKTADIAFVKGLFQRHIAGRGVLPPFRIGKQPYGIVPASAWSLWQAEREATAEEKRLIRFLKKMDAQWSKLTGQVKTMKSVFSLQNEESVKQQFRELLSVQASSTRFFRRLIAGEYLIWNINKRNAPAGTEKSGVLTTPAEFKARMETAGNWGETVVPTPRILGRFLDDENYKLTDFQAAEQLGPNARTDSGENYLSLLLEATFEQLRDRQFGGAFGDFVKQRSSRLAFYTARFALLQAWVEAATRMVQQANNKISPFARLDFETEYLAVMIGSTQLSEEHKRFLETAGESTGYETRKNKWSFFEEQIGAKRVADLLQEKITATTQPDAGDPARALWEVREALQQLSPLPDEQLERLLSEHFDLCSFRLDAWMQGIAMARVSTQRAKKEFEQGIYIGAFGYLENLRPAADAWVRVEEVKTPKSTLIRRVPSAQLVMPVYDFSGLSAREKETAKHFSFVYLGSDPLTNLVEDPLTHSLEQRSSSVSQSGQGFLLMPSADHAATAAILRAGFEHHARSQGPESRTLSVSLSPERTGRAIDMLRAVQAGHSLNEQLGYFIERAMYESEAGSLAGFVLKVRERFPLQVEVNEWDDDQEIGDDKIANLSLLTDGLQVVTEKGKTRSNPSIPTVWELFLTTVFSQSATQRNAFLAIVEEAAQLFDAVSDLLLAESVFQTVKGRPERAAAALRTASEGAEITTPEIAKMPLQSLLFTHRMGFVQASANAAAAFWPSQKEKSVLARLSPDLDRWLADQLPPPAKICALVSPENGPSKKIRLSELGLQAIDFYYLMVKTSGKAAENLLPRLFLDAAALEDGTSAFVSFDRSAVFAAGEFCIRELLPLLECLKRLLARSRPMLPEHWQVIAGNVPAPSEDKLKPQVLAKAVRHFCNEGPDGPVPLFLQKLDAAIVTLSRDQPVGFPSPETEAAFFHLFHLLPEAYWLGLWDAAPACPQECTAIHIAQLLAQAAQIAQSLRTRLALGKKMVTALAAQEAGLSSQAQFAGWLEIAKLLGGADLMVLPRFELENPGEILATHTDPHLLDEAGAFALEEWLQGVGVVRENAGDYLLLQNLREIMPCPATGRSLKIMQLPYLVGGPNVWIGGPLPEAYEPPQAATSLAFEFRGSFAPQATFTGILFDEWSEQVPVREMNGAAGIHYNQPNSEAPQVLLLAVAPVLTGSWQWPVLMQIVEETFELAKKRAIDSELLQQTWLGQFLPALIAPIDVENNTPTLDFGLAGPPVLPHIVDRPGNIGIKLDAKIK